MLQNLRSGGFFEVESTCGYFAMQSLYVLYPKSGMDENGKSGEEEEKFT